jgi:hypothetical protein
LTPHMIKSGGWSFIKNRTPIMTQSVGVPFTAWCRSLSFRMRSGSARVKECDAPLLFVSGATTQTSLLTSPAMCSRALSPGASIPSSLVIKILMRSRGTCAKLVDGETNRGVGQFYPRAKVLVPSLAHTKELLRLGRCVQEGAGASAQTKLELHR